MRLVFLGGHPGGGWVERLMMLPGRKEEGLSPGRSLEVGFWMLLEGKWRVRVKAQSAQASGRWEAGRSRGRQ